MFDRISCGFLPCEKGEVWCSGAEQTIGRDCALHGVGLHSGVDVTMLIRPAGAGTGIVFRRLDLVDGLDMSSPGYDQSAIFREARKDISIKAQPGHVFTTRLGTTLINESGATVSTVEHLMASLAAFGITNAFIDLDGAELPILDGSAELFVDAIETAGVQVLSARQRALKITRELSVGEADRWIRIAPSLRPDLDILVDVEFDDTAIGSQQVGFSVSRKIFKQNVAHARTFCSIQDVEGMRANGLALGGSMDNAIVVNGGMVLNEGGLRCENEFAMHKALDLLGDLFLIGMPVFGTVHAFKPGHDLNTRLAKAIVESDAFEIVEVPVSPAAENAWSTFNRSESASVA